MNGLFYFFLIEKNVPLVFKNLKMTKIKSWISAARLRTLPLSISGIIVGTGIAGGEGMFNSAIFSLAIITTLGLQILSNFANDYGDGVKGTDNEERVGPMRALQSGAISREQMKTGIIITSILTLLSAILLIYISFGKEHFAYSIFFFFLGMIAIVAAIKYTVGATAYGYRGLGDVFVFVFFGLVSVIGCYFLYTKEIAIMTLLPAFAIGWLSSAVLNLNNMRDHIGDAKSGKNTLVVKLGIEKAKKYHYLLIVGAMIAILVYLFLIDTFNYIDLLPLVSFFPLILHIRKVKETTEPRDLDPELKKVALSTFLLAILFAISQLF